MVTEVSVTIISKLDLREPQSPTFAPRNNIVVLSEEPGLGVTLDLGRVDQYRKLLAERGPPNQYFESDAPGIFAAGRTPHRAKLRS